MVLLSCRHPFYWCRVQMKKKKKVKKNNNNNNNNEYFLLRFHNTAFDVIFVQVILSRKYYLYLRSTEGQWFIV